MQRRVRPFWRLEIRDEPGMYSNGATVRLWADVLSRLSGLIVGKPTGGPAAKGADRLPRHIMAALAGPSVALSALSLPLLRRNSR